MSIIRGGIIIKKRVLILLLILAILCSSIVLADKVKDLLPEQHLKKVSKSLQIIDDTEEKEVVIKVKNKNTILKDKAIKDTNNKHLVTAKLKGNKLINIVKDDNIELIEEDIDINITGQLTYGIQSTNAPSAWQTTTAKGIKVAVLDTGISQHDNLKIAGGYPDDYHDNVNHGTPVAGVVTSVAPGSELYAVKIMNTSTGKISDAINGLQWAIDNKMDIVVMSFGTNINSQIFKELLEEAYNQDIVLIAAGGNNQQILYPAKYSSVIAVGSINEMNQSLTPQGFELEVMAAGDNVYTTTNTNSYAYFSGTSLAAPHVAGIAALLKTLGLTNKQIRAKLQNDAVDLGEQGKDYLYGFGLAQVNLETNNYELFEYNYNYTVYKYLNETSLLYQEGFGNIDDIDFEEGRYHAIKRYKEREYYEEFDVNDEGIIIPLTYTVDFDETWTPFEGDGNNNRVFMNQGLSAALTVGLDPDPDVECFDMKDGGNSYEECYAETSTDMTNCKNKFADLNTTCQTADCSGIDNIYTGAIGDHHSIDTSSRDVYTTKIKYYKACTGAGVMGTAQDAHYIFDRRRITCEGDGERMYEGRYDLVPSILYTEYIQNQACLSGKTCDPLLDQNDSSDSTAQILPDVCRVPDGGICSVNADCLTSHYCIEGVCDDTSANVCDGRFDITVLDVAGNSMQGMYVYLEGINNGTTDGNGFKSITFNDVLCNNLRNVSIRCFNNQTRECATISKTVVNGNTNNVNSFVPQGCNVCRGVPNLKIDSSSIKVTKTSTFNYDINVTVQSENVQANDVVVTYTGLDKFSGLIVQSQQKNKTVSFSTTDLNKTVTANINTIDPPVGSYVIDYVMIQVDPNKQVNEDKKDNFVIVPMIFDKKQIKLTVKTSNAFLNQAIEEYLRLFFDVNNTNYDFIVSVGNPLENPDSKIPDSVKHYGWGFDEDKRTVVYNNIADHSYDHIGLVGREGNKIVVYGNYHEGTIAAVKRLVNARDRLFIKNGKPDASYLDKYDILGVGVIDILYNRENKPFFDEENVHFKRIVSDILNDNNFEIAIKTVKTTNDNTMLRMKNLNSDFSQGYKDVVTNSNKPVVFAGGLFSGLLRWEEDNGLAEQMVQEGRDSWEIEITGGPGQDCPTCVNYKYEDLVDYYWPALIAGVMNYSGKNQIDYVGHSNGCRTALSSLKNWSISGKNNAGYCFNLQTGLYDIECDLPSNPVDVFVGLGCPGALNGNSHVITQSLKNGDSVLTHFQNNNEYHISGREFAKKLDLDYSLFWPTYKISLNLASFYNNIMKLPNDTIPINGLFINHVYLIAGEDSISEWGKHDGDDGIVPLEDPIAINTSLNYTAGELIIFTEPHHSLPDNDQIQDYIKTKLIR